MIGSYAIQPALPTGYQFNKKLAAEWNIKNDPIAAKIVFDSGIPLRVIGLDVTLKLKIQCTDFLCIPHPDLLKPVVKNAEKFLILCKMTAVLCF